MVAFHPKFYSDRLFNTKQPVLLVGLFTGYIYRLRFACQQNRIFQNITTLRFLEILNRGFLKKISQMRKQALVKIVGALMALLVILGVWHHSSNGSKHNKKHHKKVTHTQEVNS